MAGEIEALLANIPTAAGQGKVPSWIGLPPGYVPEDKDFRGEGRNYKIPGTPPRYMEGDEVGPASLAPERIAELQQQMVVAGLIPPKAKYRPGYWDDTTRGAYKELLAYANYQDKDYREMLDLLVASPVMGDEEPERQPLTTRVSSPDDIAAVIRATSKDVIGRSLSDQETQRLVSAYQQQEAGAQAQAYGMAETGGAMVDPPSAANFAEKQIRMANPVEAEGQELTGVFDSFMKIVGGAGMGG